MQPTDDRPGFTVPHDPAEAYFDLPTPPAVHGAAPTAAPVQRPQPRDPSDRQEATVSTQASAGERTASRRWLGVLAVASIVAAIALRVVALDRLPGEMYGDIAIVYEYVAAIRARQWPTYFVLSAGPLYHYLITPLVAVDSFDFLGLKLSSALVSCIALAGLFAFARELVDDELGWLAVFVAGVSTWLLVFSRLGNSQILVPALVILALYLCARMVRRRLLRDALLAGGVAALGLYVYPQSFILAPTVLVVLLWFYVLRGDVSVSHIAAFVCSATVCALPFVRIVRRDPANFFSGYIGGKLAPQTGVVQALLTNTAHTLLALHVHGDPSFRANAAGLPELDPVSGLLFLIGLVCWLRPARRRLSPLILIPLLILPLPSMLVLGRPEEVPSASRLLGVAPLVYLLVASGVWWPLQLLRRQRWLARVATAVALLLILGLNGYRYFALYAAGLPDHNTPFGRTISDYLDGLPADTHAFIVDCCWGQAGQPEPKAIQYGGKSAVSHGLIELHSLELTCARLQQLPRPAVFIWEPDVALPAPPLAFCRSQLRPEAHASPDHVPIFRSSMVNSP